jgi:two-component system nitrate/nitrite response regulator NarL
MQHDSGLRRSESTKPTDRAAPARTTILIVAEIRLYREGIAYLLRRHADIEVVAAAASWPEARRLLGTSLPDIVLLDMVMPGAKGIVREIRSLESAPKVIALAVPDDEDDVIACAASGVSGYVTREDSFETLVAAVRSVARGELLCTPRMAAALFERVSALTGASEHEESFRLTPRERQVAELIVDELSNKAIAQRLRIELPTVKNHIHSIFEKLQVHRRSDAVARLRAARN